MQLPRFFTVLAVCAGLCVAIASCDSNDPAAADRADDGVLNGQISSNEIGFAQNGTDDDASKKGPVPKITDGEIDGNDHPLVVLLMLDVGGGPAFRCSGTLLSPTVVLTAGHCTSNFPGVPGLPFYGEMPEVDQLDVMKTKRGRQDVTFTAVGYGLQRVNPVFIQAEKVRMYATPHLIQINTPGFTGDFSMLLSNNHSTGGTCFGGTCFGGSGGPNLLGSGLSESRVVAAVTSFGLNGNCAGRGGVFRMDRQNVLDFVNSYLP